MKFSLGAGAEVDIATGEELDAAVKDLKSEIKLCRPEVDPRPIRRKIVLGKNNAIATGIYDSAGGCVVLTPDGAIASPSVGRVWDVRSLVLIVTGSPSNGLGSSFPSINGGDPNLPTPIDIKPGSSLLNTPMGTTFTKGAIIINPNEELYVVVNKPVALTNYMAVVEVDDFNDRAYEAQTI